MKIEFDPEADALYIELSSGEFELNRKVDDDVILDIDKKGNIIGIEILNVSQKVAKNFLSDVSIRNLVRN